MWVGWKVDDGESCVVLNDLALRRLTRINALIGDKSVARFVDFMFFVGVTIKNGLRDFALFVQALVIGNGLPEVIKDVEINGAPKENFEFSF